ncbi:MAG TPA: hypothetical protein VEY09_11155 [Pyrinomonadaceae bacterium]|nr:hypothetical protein [Pyrinomonadaceae bacterium]
MSTERDRVRELAERVARRLGDAPGRAGGAPVEGTDLPSLRSALGEIQRRLAHIESHLAHDGACDHEASGPGSGAKGDEPPRQQAAARGPGQGGEKASQASARSTWLSGTYVPAAVSHPSQDHFTNVGEAVSELVEFLEGEKTCTVEPGGKPCDHCGMCSARGF